MDYPGRNRKIAVIGGGASGMMAAIAAAEQGANVTLFERQARVGRKLAATGNGRCNLTNTHAVPARYHGAEPAFPPGVVAARVYGYATAPLLWQTGGGLDHPPAGGRPPRRHGGRHEDGDLCGAVPVRHHGIQPQERCAVLQEKNIR